jgi:hypothetical protein
LQNQQKKIPTAAKLSGKLRGTSLKVKVFTQTPVEYKSIELDYKLLQKDQKKRSRDTLIGLQHQHKNTHMYKNIQEKVRGTSLKVKVFTQTPVEYKSIELDYKLLLERPKKAVKDTLIGLQHQHKNTHMYRKFQES